MSKQDIPPPCDASIFQRGTPVFRTDTIRSVDMEPWVQKVAARSGQPVDWHFAGGRAIVLALGDLDKVRAALIDLLPEHDALWRSAARVGSGNCFAMSERDAKHYLSAMKRYAGLFGPREIAETGAEERAKFTIQIIETEERRT